MQLGFFVLYNWYGQLSKLKDPLVELNRIIDWNLFADLLAETTAKPRRSTAGRKPFDRVLLFKILVLQRMNNLSVDRLEYQVRDRLSFMRLLGLNLAGTAPITRKSDHLRTHKSHSRKRCSQSSAHGSTKIQQQREVTGTCTGRTCIWLDDE